MRVSFIIALFLDYLEGFCGYQVATPRSYKEEENELAGPHQSIETA